MSVDDRKAMNSREYGKDCVEKNFGNDILDSNFSRIFFVGSLKKRRETILMFRSDLDKMNDSFSLSRNNETRCQTNFNFLFKNFRKFTNYFFGKILNRNGEKRNVSRRIFTRSDETDGNDEHGNES